MHVSCCCCCSACSLNLTLISPRNNGKKRHVQSFYSVHYLKQKCYPKNFLIIAFILEIKIASFHFNFSPPNSIIQVCLVSFKTLSVFSLIVVTCMSICTCIYVTKFSLSNLCNLTYMHVFRANHLVFNEQLVCSSLLKIVFFILSMYFLSIVLCVGLRSLVLF